MTAPAKDLSRAAARDLVHELLSQSRLSMFGRCAYCGGLCRGRTCQAHRDLPQLEHDIYTASNGPTASDPTDCAAGPSTEKGR